MAVWCVPRTGSQPTTLEVHFNYWRINGGPASNRTRGTERDFIEIGLMIGDLRQIKRICVFLPQTVEHNQVIDCSQYFSDPKLAQGVFNEVLSANIAAPGGARCIVLNSTSGVFCKMHSFVATGSGIDDNELAIQTEHNGSLLTITESAVGAACLYTLLDERAYFRFRVYLSTDISNNPFIKVVPTPDRLLQSGFDQIEYLDFRMNEARTLPMPVEARMKRDRAQGGDVKLSLVAFLTAVPVHSELAISNTPAHKMRLLEAPIWNDYVPSGLSGGMVVYHWKREGDTTPIIDFSAFIKLQTRQSSRWTVSKYLIIAFLFGIVGNLAASLLWACFTTTALPPPPMISKSCQDNTVTRPGIGREIISPESEVGGK